MRPQDFLIGVRDFFAILIPGAVLLMLLLPRDFLSGRDGSLALVAFTIAAYLCGAVAAALGSALDRIVDPLILSMRLGTRFWPDFAARKTLAEALRDRLVEAGLEGRELPAYAETTRSFWWDHLRLSCPEAIAELDRREAYQKLFRALSVVFLLLFLLTFVPGFAFGPAGIPLVESHPGAVFLAASILSFAVYAAGRYTFESALYRLAAASYLHKRLR